MYNFNVQITIVHKLFVIKCREALINLPMNLMHVFTFLEVFSRTKLLKTSIQNGLTVFKINQLILNTFVVVSCLYKVQGYTTDPLTLFFKYA